MTALRQEALQIVNDVPENLLAEFVSYLRKFQIESDGINPKKAAALADIEKWQERNRNILSSGIDWDKELEDALDEKYSVIN